MKIKIIMYFLLFSTSLFSMDFRKDWDKPLEHLGKKKEIAPNKDNSLENANAIIKKLEYKYYREEGWSKDAKISLLNDFEKELHPNAITEQLLNKLCQTNSLMSKIMNHFISVANDNLNGITMQSLDTINNSCCWQPTQDLNKIPYEIKKYVMQCAADKIVNTLTFKGHTDYIYFLDINAKAKKAVTVSADKTFRLWDLETETCVWIIPEKGIIKESARGYVKFNDIGSLICTATLTEKDCVVIKVWNTASYDLQYSIESYPYIISGVDFLDTLLIIYSWAQVSYYRLGEKRKIRLEKTTGGSFIPQYIFTDSYGYCNACFSRDTTTWSIQKKGCTPFSLSLRAIQNTKDSKSFYCILKTETYHVLSENEKKRIDQELQKKVIELSKK